MSDAQFPIGRRISLPGHFAESVVLEAVRLLGEGCECRVRLTDGSLDEVVLSPQETEELRGHESIPEKGRLVDSTDLQLLVESARIRLAYAHDRQFAVSLSGIRTLPHQIEAVYQKMLPQPSLRFLLADDPGAGKTIMAGLLVKELKLREIVDRVLILCPAPLTIQWQDEMQRWFGETFDIIFAAVDQQQLSNPWQRSNQVIASIDYAKQEDVRERIWQQHWNLVIIDEAHKCSARTGSGGAGRESRIVTTRRYDLAAKLVNQCDNLLMLTATPHHGDEDKFAHFLRLLDRDLFPEPHRLGPQASKIRNDVFRLGDNCPWALRRLKEDLKDMDGQRLFPDRHAVTVPFMLNADEFSLYKSVTAYINEYIPQQQGQHRSSAALARTVLQRRLASSACAIHESLKRRLQKQQDLLTELEGLSPAQRARRLAALQGRLVDSEQDEDDLDDDDRDHLIDEYTAAIEIDQLRTEIAALKDLVDNARKVREAANDSKLKALQGCLARAQFAELKDGRGKLLLFTEHRDTLNYVEEHLERWGYSTCEIHGGMNPHHRKWAQEQFRTRAQVCVATEAAGEGINLQFCHLMINYDMPWNPTRLEQRLGRIHRIGQRDDCYVFNFVATSGENGDAIVEGKILERLLEKLEIMKKSLEGRVFDVIGEVLSLNDVNLPEMLREAAVDPRRLDDYLEQIDRIDPDKLREYEEATGIALARGHVDFTSFQQRNLEIEERRLMPKYVEEQFIAATKRVGLRVEPRADGLWRVEHVLADLRSERLAAVQKLGKADTEYRKITFRKEVLEQDQHLDAVLLGPGHPLYAAVDERLNENLAESVGGTALFMDDRAANPYRLHFFEINIRGKDTRGNDVLLYAEVVAVREEAGLFDVVPPDVLIDLAPHPHLSPEIGQIDPQPASDYLKSTYQIEIRQRCQHDRQQFAQIVRDYLERSFKTRISKAQERYMHLMAELSLKPEYKLASDEAKRYLDDLERSRKERLAGLDRLQIARTGPVRHLATAVVLPPDADTASVLSQWGVDTDPESRRRKELAAEKIAVADLESEGFPEDLIQRVAHEKLLGFDYRAQRPLDATTGVMEVRRIEVKGYTHGNSVQMEHSEWTKAQQLQDTYWLYVVWNPLSPDYELVKIQNPYRVLEHAVKHREVIRRYEIPAEAIDGHRRQGES
ncbi:MAG: DEAD/DEAH box helicase family protein [Pirellulales bacterium]|nr:DEAD/DEAH box helicase family protein [Pirellulales bacterium]